MRARQRKVLAAVEAGHDETLAAAVRGVVDGELSLPYFAPGDSGAEYKKKLAARPKRAHEMLLAVEKNEQVVEAKCDALGRHING